MNKSELLEKILSQEYQSDAEKLEILLEKYYKENPSDIEVLLRLALVELVPNLVDPEKSRFFLHKILETEPDNCHALLVLASIDDAFFGGITRENFIKLHQAKMIDQEHIAMLELAQAWYYRALKDRAMYLIHLQQSMQAYSGHVWNHIEMGRYLLREGNIASAMDSFQKGISNIKMIYSPEYFYDISDIEEYLTESFKGTHMSKLNFDALQRDYDNILDTGEGL